MSQDTPSLPHGEAPILDKPTQDFEEAIAARLVSRAALQRVVEAIKEFRPIDPEAYETKAEAFGEGISAALVARLFMSAGMPMKVAHDDWCEAMMPFIKAVKRLDLGKKPKAPKANKSNQPL